MKKVISIILVTLFFIVCLSVNTIYAETDGFPTIIKNALDKYKKEGTDVLMPALLKGSPLEGDKTALSQASLVTQIETFYGKYHSYEKINIVTISESTKLVYYVMNYEKGPLFSTATVYKINGQEIIINFKFHTDIHQIIPSDAIFNKY